MDGIMKLITDADEHYRSFRTAKVGLDTDAFDSLHYDERPALAQKVRNKLAETNKSGGNIVGVRRDKDIRPIFSYFLDGTRHIYKVDDIGISNKIYPVLAGQIIVGCCHRDNSRRDAFATEKLVRKLVLALPQNFAYDESSEAEELKFCKKKTEEVNEALRRTRYASSTGLRLDKILLYETDQKGERDQQAPQDIGRDTYKDRGTAAIQTEMMDDEQELVHQLCAKNLLDASNYLIKDGSLQYRANRDHPLVKMNYEHVVGVSKNFNPESLSALDKDISRTIAQLRPYERTRAYRYCCNDSDEDMQYAVWYLRLRDNWRRSGTISDVVKCEMVLTGDEISSDTVDMISQNLLNEAYPVCHGRDTRWERHLYPVFLTESYCKSKYLNEEVIFKIF